MFKIFLAEKSLQKELEFKNIYYILVSGRSVGNAHQEEFNTEEEAIACISAVKDLLLPLTTYMVVKVK